MKENNETVAVKDDIVYLCEKLNEVIKACGAFDIRAAKTAMAELKNKAWSDEVGDLIKGMSLELVGGDFERVVAEAERIIATYGN